MPKSLPQRLRRRVRGRIRSALGDLRLLPFVLPRRFHAYGCGIGKTGTHSINAIFSNYRTAHEVDIRRTVRLVVAYRDGTISDQEIERLLLRRDRQLWLEMDSSGINGDLAKPLARISPEAKFVLTIRDVYSWADSAINQIINFRPLTTPWAPLYRRRLRLGVLHHTPQDEPLESRGLPPLASFMISWDERNRNVLDSVPDDRLMIVRTPEIGAQAAAIGAFVGVPADNLVLERAQSYVTKNKHGVLAELDSAYVRDMAERYCGDLMRRFFPDVRPYDGT
ncbi:MAG: sulfotransferase [Alphaproteobacteria bacterium]|nr:sulfotransferase [Alphaproteobacteria bacterium]